MEFWQVLKGLDKGVLRRVLRIVGIPQQAPAEAVYSVLVGDDYLIEGCFVAVLEPGYEGEVVRCLHGAVRYHFEGMILFLIRSHACSRGDMSSGP